MVERDGNGGGGGGLSIAERRALRKAARINSRTSSAGEEKRDSTGAPAAAGDGGGGGNVEHNDNNNNGEVCAPASAAPAPAAEGMSIAQRRAMRKAARLNSQNSTTEEETAEAANGEGGGGGESSMPPIRKSSDRRGGPGGSGGGSGGRGRGGFRGRRFASNNKRKLKRQKTKWEENMGIIDELLIPGSKTFEAMTARQRERLWDVKKSLISGGRSTGEMRTQHVPKELIQGTPVVEEEEDEGGDGLGKPQDHPGGRRTSNVGRQRNSDFILREYAGIKRESLMKDLEEMMESSEQEEVNIIEEEEGSEEEEEEEENNQDNKRGGGEEMTEESLRMTRDSIVDPHSISSVDGKIDKNFLPQEFAFLDEAKQTELFELLSWESITSWDFDVFKLDEVSDGHPLLFMGWAVISAPYAQQAMATKLGLTLSAIDTTTSNIKAGKMGKWGYTFMEDLKIPSRKLCHYLRSIEEDYNKVNPYHNAIHAADVVQTMHTLIQKSKHECIFRGMPSINNFAILLAAVVHDVEHPGKTNGFHIKVRSELALVHNDASVLENHHVAHAFATMFALDLSDSYNKASAIAADPHSKIKDRRSSKDDENSPNNLLCNASQEEFEKIRKLMIEAILHTDMTKHFEGVNAARGVLMELKDNGGNYEDIAKKKEHSWTILMYMLHMADISSQAKGPHLFSQWTHRCLEEFFIQGDLERELGLPVSALCDRNTTSVPESQVGFIQFVVEPAFGVLGEYSAFVKDEVLPIIYTNLDHWSALQEG